METSGDSIDVWMTTSGDLKQLSSTDIDSTLTFDGQIAERIPLAVSTT